MSRHTSFLGRSHFKGAVALAALTLSVTPVSAQPETAAACVTTDAGLPAALAAWPAKVDLLSATSASDLPKAEVIPGQAARVMLHGARDVGCDLCSVPSNARFAGRADLRTRVVHFLQQSSNEARELGEFSFQNRLAEFQIAENPV